MTRGTTRMLMGVLALALVVTLAAPAYALAPIETDTTGSIYVQVQDEAYLEDLDGAMVPVTVYQVATVNQYGAFALTDAFNSLQNTDHWNGGILEDKTEVGDTRVSGLLEAALALVQPAEPEDPAEPPAEPAEPAIEPVFDGQVAVGEKIDLPVGLYLVIPGKAETAQWEYAFNPALLAAPSIERASDQNQLPEDRWQYDVPMYLKGERERRLTSLVIEKTLQQYNATLGETTFIFEVTAEIDGKTVYSNVVGLSFTGPGTNSVTVSGIPAGAHVTVEEVYSGGSYTLTAGNGIIEELKAPEEGSTDFDQVSFTNTYTNERIPDGSVVNRYVSNGTGWDYQEEAEQ